MQVDPVVPLEGVVGDLEVALQLQALLGHLIKQIKVFRACEAHDNKKMYILFRTLEVN